MTESAGIWLLGDWNLIKSYHGLPKIMQETAKGLKFGNPALAYLPLFQKPLKNSSDAIQTVLNLELLKTATVA